MKDVETPTKEKRRKKISLSKETLRELTARPLTEEEAMLAAGGGFTDTCQLCTCGGGQGTCQFK